MTRRWGHATSRSGGGPDGLAHKAMSGGGEGAITVALGATTGERHLGQASGEDVCSRMGRVGPSDLPLPASACLSYAVSSRVPAFGPGHAPPQGSPFPQLASCFLFPSLCSFSGENVEGAGKAWGGRSIYPPRRLSLDTWLCWGPDTPLGQTGRTLQESSLQQAEGLFLAPCPVCVRGPPSPHGPAESHWAQPWGGGCFPHSCSGRLS